MSILLPSEATCLLEYYYLPHTDIVHNQPNVLEALISLNLVVLPAGGVNGEITNKGRAHVYHMLQVPLPVKVWQLPESPRGE